MFDLLLNCPTVVRHIADGRAAFGINHAMVNPQTNESKKLDLVYCTQGCEFVRTLFSLSQASLAGMNRPDATESRLLASLPSADVLVAAVSFHGVEGVQDNMQAISAASGENLGEPRCDLGAQADAIAVAYGWSRERRFVSAPSNRKSLGGSFAARGGRDTLNHAIPTPQSMASI